MANYEMVINGKAYQVDADEIDALYQGAIAGPGEDLAAKLFDAMGDSPLVTQAPPHPAQEDTAAAEARAQEAAQSTES